MEPFPDLPQILQISIRLIAAALLGAVVGIQRERMGKSAGVRTHMLVAMGTAFIVAVPLEHGFSSSDLARVIQGLAAGVGFIGGGAILKIEKDQEITGLTTAAGIWMTAAVGVAVGLGRVGSAAVGVFLTWIILSVVGQIEHRLARGKDAKPSP